MGAAGASSENVTFLELTFKGRAISEKAMRQPSWPIEAANALADAGLEPQRNYLTVLDEMRRAMRFEGAGLVDKADSIAASTATTGSGTCPSPTACATCSQ